MTTFPHLQPFLPFCMNTLHYSLPCCYSYNSLYSSLQAIDDSGKALHMGHHDWLFLSSVQPCPSRVGVCCWALLIT